MKLKLTVHILLTVHATHVSCIIVSSTPYSKLMVKKTNHLADLLKPQSRTARTLRNYMDLEKLIHPHQQTIYITYSNKVEILWPG